MIPDGPVNPIGGSIGYWNSSAERNGRSESAAGGFASIGRPSKLGRAGCELEASCACAGSPCQPANARPISRNQCSLRFAADRLILRGPSPRYLTTRTFEDDRHVDDCPFIGDRLLSRRGCNRRSTVPNIVQKSAASDHNIEGSTDYAQKNDDADYMSGSGKMVILREGRLSINGLTAKAGACALSSGT